MFGKIIRTMIWSTVGLSCLATVSAIQGSRTATRAAASIKLESPPLNRESQAKNPTVTPGLVKWHATYEAAQQAARKSGKPILLLHLMGRLDKQFC